MIIGICGLEMFADDTVGPTTGSRLNLALEKNLEIVSFIWVFMWREWTFTFLTGTFEF
jgi:hypothetical protein